MYSENGLVCGTKTLYLWFLKGYLGILETELLINKIGEAKERENGGKINIR